MAIILTEKEKNIAKHFFMAKQGSGSHSPSPATLGAMAGFSIDYDFCYLSNPYAAALFLRNFRQDFLHDDDALRKVIELYPSQNRFLAKQLGVALSVSSEQLFIGNGATEIIQAVLQHFSRKKILVPIPTFSPYLEFVPAGVDVVHHQLKKEHGYALQVNDFLAQIEKEKPDTVVLINPNNPDGGYLKASALKKLLMALATIPTVIVDESFIHFADKNSRVWSGSASLVKKYSNLVVIKSLSKDFGIAGLRLGYAVMASARVSQLLKRGYLWNISGFGEYVIQLLQKKKFRHDYEQARLKEIDARDRFFKALRGVRGIRVCESSANFFLVELIDGSKAEDVVIALLCRYGIYVRPCNDKVGLQGEYIRIASRSEKENTMLINALKSSL
jgi:histidinol-phosphate/aromatic aminotransferase/cobyric acid decarboxylase-like protein